MSVRTDSDAAEIAALHAEIERLRASLSPAERYWEARWRDEAKLTDEAAAFLDVLANRLEVASMPECDAAECRAMAAKLRSE